MTGTTTQLLDPRVRLHVVTGKGGTGKSTIAGALAVALAGQGRRVLLAEVEGREAIAATFGIAPGSGESLLLQVNSGGVYGLSVSPKSALTEYLDMYYKLGPAGSVLEKIGAIDFATTIAPGTRDLLLIGKVYEAVRRRRTGRRVPTSTTDAGQEQWLYDAVVLDAPPTGRVVKFLGVGGAVGDLTRVGPIHNQSRSIMKLLRSPASAVHLTTLPEEMPVQETIDAVAELREESLPVGTVFVNEAAADLLTPTTMAALEANAVPAERVQQDLEALGLPSDHHTAAALVRQGHRHLNRLTREDAQIDRLEALGRPVLLLPRLLDPKGPAGLRRLADEMTAQVPA